MKNLIQNRPLIILLLLFSLSASAFSGTVPHLVGGTVRYDTGEIPETVSVTAYIQSRSSEVLTEDSSGCGYEDGYFWIQCGNFPTDWQSGDILYVEIRDVSDHSQSATVTLTNSSLDTVHFILYPLKYKVTVETSPSGLAVYVDGDAYFTPADFYWEENTSHDFDILSPQIASIDTRYIFSGWQHGGSQAQTITVSGDMELVAEFVPQYKLFTYAYPVSSGTVVVNPEKTWYDVSDTVQLTAVPDTGKGYLFNYWDGDASGTNSTISIQMNAAKTARAYFTLKGFNLNIDNSPEDGGYVIIDPDKNQYVYGDTISLYAIENDGEGYFFDEWQGDLTGYENPVEYIVSKETNITAIYRKKRYRLNIQVKPATAGAFLLAPNKMNFEFGENVIVTALPADGYRFHFWGGDWSGVQNPDTVAIKKDMTIVVNFTESTPVEEKQIIPKSVVLNRNYPNPFNGETVIPFELPESEKVSIIVYNPLGKVVRTLLDQQMQAGYHPVKWNGRDDAGKPVQSGIYLIHFKSGAITKFMKVMYIK